MSSEWSDSASEIAILREGIRLRDEEIKRMREIVKATEPFVRHHTQVIQTTQTERNLHAALMRYREFMNK